MIHQEYDVIVVGGGHAGSEAAAAAANMGSKVLLITMNMQTIAQMSCNPAMGGVAKGQIVRELDALGGYSGIVADKSRVQFRMLNKSKGPAMWSPRSQNDRMLFAQQWRTMLENTPNVDFWQDMGKEVIIENGKAVGVRTGLGLEIRSKSVILTNGTFLNGVIHVGMKQLGGGRMGERASTGLTAQLEDLGFESARMKTGTPPRLDGRSLDYSKMEEQQGDENPEQFSFLPLNLPEQQLSCHIAYTNPDVHNKLREGFSESPMFNGAIEGIGPRYCPSIEDKIDRFAERERHQLFVEPEGWHTHEIYLNGFSTSLPEHIQYEAIRLIPGFENAKLFRPGYAIEYDFFQPTQLYSSLETKLIDNLFFAGQINGTTGYEEAAAQGLMAGVNAHLKVNGKEDFVLKRSEAYIGVLIDDLVNKGTDEPYRMFTSRAEYRITLRQDSTDIRLTPISYEIGLAGEERMKAVQKKQKGIKKVIKVLKKQSIAPEEVNPGLEKLNSSALSQKVKAESLVTRPELNIQFLRNHSTAVDEKLSPFTEKEIEAAEILLKYDGYLQKERDLVEKMEKLEAVKLGKKLNYREIRALSSEAQEKLSDIQPATLGQASRISGVSPADISVLMIQLNEN